MWKQAPGVDLGHSAHPLIRFLVGPCAVALLTWISFRWHFNLAAAGPLQLLLVVVISIVYGFWEATVTSLLAVNCLNYFFVPPLLTFYIADIRNWVALASFEGTALIASRIASRMRTQTREATLQRAATQKLYELSSRILLLDRRRSAGRQLVDLIKEEMHADVGLLDDAEAHSWCAGGVGDEMADLARTGWILEAEAGGPDGGAWRRILRLGSSASGALALRGPDLDALAVDAVASATAI